MIHFSVQRFFRFGVALASLASVALSATAAEGDYPVKPISIVVAYAPGGQGDTFARLVSERLAIAYKQSVVVDNKPGVSGTVGTRLAVKTRNDGYTLLLGQTGEIVVNRVIMKDLGYDPLKELIPVVMIGNAPLVLLASASAPYNSLTELIQMARAKPGTFSYGSVGAGTPGHLAAVALTMGTKLDMTHIPYKGVGPLLTDLMTDRIQLFFSSASAAMPHIKGGKLKALAVTSPQRMKSLPQVPTVAEATLPGFSYSLWGGLFAPADTPAAIVQSLNREVNAIMASTEIHNRFVAEDLAVPKNTVAEFTEFVRTEAAKFEKVVKDANIKID